MYVCVCVCVQVLVLAMTCYLPSVLVPGLDCLTNLASHVSILHTTRFLLHKKVFFMVVHVSHCSCCWTVMLTQWTPQPACSHQLYTSASSPRTDTLSREVQSIQSIKLDSV